VLADRLPAAADISRLPYLSMVVSEVLRLYPPTWSLLRDVIDDDTIGGFHIPAESQILFDVYLTHRLSEYWRDPETFDPERFLPEKSAGRPRFAYLPFGGGPRQCIGNELALMEIKLIMARMAQMYRFRLVSVPPLRMEALTSLRPRGGVWMTMKARTS
jgi:cytochrome P450